MLTNPLLPIKLKNTRVISTKHTFVSYLNITELSQIQSHLDIQLLTMTNNSFITRNPSNLTDNLLKQAHTLSSVTNHLIQTINPHMRNKRGLVNLGGKISKWLFGTLDADDGKRIDTILKHLDRNDHLLQDKINSEITLAKPFIVETNRSLFQIKSNILTIVQTVNKESERIDALSGLQLLIDTYLIFQNTMYQIINAITFANLNKVHPTFLSIKHLNFILNKMKTIYSHKQLVYFHYRYNYYSLLGIQLIYSDEKIIFLLHFPIMMPTLFETYLLLPIPMQNKLLTIPNPYLILNERNGEHQYQANPCEEIENTYYCRNQLHSEKDCVIQIITTYEGTNCTTVPVHMDKPLLAHVTPEDVLLISPVNTTVTEYCSVEKHHKLQN